MVNYAFHVANNGSSHSFISIRPLTALPIANLVKRIIISIGLFIIPSFSYAASVTVDANLSARIGRDACGGTTWSTLRNASTPDYDGCGILDAGSDIYSLDSSADSLLRVIEKFPVGASLPDNATVTGATVCHYYSSKADNNNQSVGMTQYSGATLTSAAYTDYSKINSQTGTTDPEGITRADITGITTGTYTCHTLNATGISWISNTADLIVGWRLSGDLDNTGGSDPAAQIQWNSATGTNKPYITVHYSVPASSSSSSSSGSGASFGTGARLGFNHYCNAYSNAEGTLCSGSGCQEIIMPVCSEWATTVQLDMAQYWTDVAHHSLLYAAGYSAGAFLLIWILWKVCQWVFRLFFPRR